MAAADAAVRDSQNGIRGLPKRDPRTPKTCSEGFLEPKQQEAYTGGPKNTISCLSKALYDSLEGTELQHTVFNDVDCAVVTSYSHNDC